MSNTRERNAVIKRALSTRFGSRNVSVKAGRGTALAWVDVRITVGTSPSCYCARGETLCRLCVEYRQTCADEARRIIYGSLERRGLRLSTYSSDDGSGDERDCLALQVEIKRKYNV